MTCYYCDSPKAMPSPCPGCGVPVCLQCFTQRLCCDSPRAHGYTRVSTEEQVLGLKSQDTAIVRYCDFRGFTLSNLYTDHGVSGSLPLAQRPRGNALLHALRDGDHVVIHKLDRAWRSARDCLETVEGWEKRNITLHVVDMNLDLGTPMGRFFLTVAVGFAEMERRIIAQRTREGLAASDKPLGNRPYGELPGERIIIDKARTLRGAGLSWREVARSLDQAGDRTRSGKPWDPEVIRRILTR